MSTEEVVVLLPTHDSHEADATESMERKNIRWTRERDVALLRQIVFTGIPAFLTARHSTRTNKYDQSKIWTGEGGIIPRLSEVECFEGVRMPGYQSVINHVTAPASGLLAKYRHLYMPGQEQAEPAEAGTEGTKNEAPLGEFGNLIVEVAQLWNESKLLEKEKKDSKESAQVENHKEHSEMQAAAVQKKYGSLSAEELHGSRSQRVAARREREAHDSTSSSDDVRKKQRKQQSARVRMHVEEYCMQHPDACYDTIIQGGDKVPKGYKLFHPGEDPDAELQGYFLEKTSCEDVSDVLTMRDKLAVGIESLGNSRTEREKNRKDERHRELALEERRLQLEEARLKHEESRAKQEEERAKREAKKDRVLLKLLTKLAKADGNSDDSASA